MPAPSLDRRGGADSTFSVGRRRPGSWVNFATHGTIEQRVSVLEFKQSVFAKVPDGGEGEAFLGGTRSKRFMGSVVAAIPCAAWASSRPHLLRKPR